MINDCQSERSIIKDYTKLTDAQLKPNVLKGYEGAIAEAKRRGWQVPLTSQTVMSKPNQIIGNLEKPPLLSNNTRVNKELFFPHIF